MSVPNEIISLSGGRSVAVSEYGVPNGEPVFFFHGWPSSRTMAQLTDAAARDLNLRIISPDRPGIRGSSFQPFNPSQQPLLAVTTSVAALTLWAFLGFEAATIPAHAAEVELTAFNAAVTDWERVRGFERL